MGKYVEKINDGAYFVVDSNYFSLTTITYNPVLANQTVDYGWEPSPIEVKEEPLPQKLSTQKKSSI